VKFLTFKECAERLNAILLLNCPIRDANGRFGKVCVFDFDADPWMDVFLDCPAKRSSRNWDNQTKEWIDRDLEAATTKNHPTLSKADEEFVAGRIRGFTREANETWGRFGRFLPKTHEWKVEWVRLSESKVLDHDQCTCFDEPPERNFDFSLDINDDGTAEVIRVCGVGICIHVRDSSGAVRHPFRLPDSVELIDRAGRDGGLRFVDINADGKLDCLFSNHERYSLHLFKDMKEGWSIKVIDGVRGRSDGNIGPEIPPFVRADDTNNGAWFHSGALWLMNEDTWRLPDHVFKLTFAEMLGKKEPGAGGQEPVKAQGALLDKPAVAPARSSTQYSVLSTKKPADAPANASTSPPRPLSPSPSPASPSPILEVSPPRSPEDSLKVLHVRRGMTVELVAAEPLIVDPVAFDWGPDGRLWVVEMHDYPSGITWRKEGDEFGKPGGRVKVLTDTNGDGRYDVAKTFLDGLPFPTGVKVWRKGILVTAAPTIFYAEDTNGDDKADVRKTLYQGFGEGNQQHRVNGLRWGLDNWLYVGNGDSGGIIKAVGALNTSARIANNGSEVNVNGRDLRIRPDTGEIDGQSGQTQFGREQDDWGNWFGGNNSNPMWHYTLEDHYLRRNPHFAPPGVRKQVSVSPGAAPVFPRSKTLARFNDYNMANRFTSACSQMIYRDELLGQEYSGNMFVCEPVHNLVSREIVTPAGSTFTGRRAEGEEQSEFLASEDNWFRPSMVRTGPDGALYVADMYRLVIEHPKWIPLDMQRQIADLRAGDDKGRIYLIYPSNKKPRPIARLDKLDTAGLVAALDSPNGPQRDLAQQMLLWRADKSAIEPLTKMARQAWRPQARVHALCTLDGLAGLADQLLIEAMRDQFPGVRRHGVRLSEGKLAASGPLAAEVMRRAGDPDAQVRMQAAYSLGHATCNSCGNKLGQMLMANHEDPYIVAAALSSVHANNLGQVLTTVMAAGNPPSGSADALRERLLAMAARMGATEALNAALAKVLDQDGMSSVVAVLDSLERQKLTLAAALSKENRGRIAQRIARLRQTIKAEQEAGTLGESAPAALALLARGLDEREVDDLQLLAGLLAARTPAAWQTAAVAALGRTGKPAVPGLMLAGWPSHTPAVRGQILDALISREAWTGALLDAVEKGTVPASQVDARRRQQLATSKNEAIRSRAAKVLTGSINTDRQQVLEQYLKAIADHQPDSARGKEVFAKRCANCHRLEGLGHAVGPDLAALNNRSREVLFIAMLDPSRAVEDRYLDYAVRTSDGQTLTGMLREETGTSITLAAAEGKTATILRSEIERIQSSGKSLMPEGVEKDITPAEMADVAAYLATNSPPPKELAGNKPEVVRPFVDGSIRLVATAARVYGPSIVLEEKYRNLGYWQSEEDYAAWSFDGAEESEYRVVIDYACENGTAGNSIVVTVAGQTVGGVVAGTGTWDNYSGKDLGAVKLPAGAGELVIRSGGPIKGALLDLRGVRLAPVRR